MQVFARRASVPPATGESRSAAFKRAGFRALFRQGESCAIGQFLAVDTDRQVLLVAQALGFVETLGSVDGLDGFLLTGVVALRQAGRYRMARRVLDKIKIMPRGLRPDHVPVWNSMTRGVTFFRNSHEAIAGLQGRAIPGRAPGEAVEDHDSCVNAWRFGASVVGAALGAGAGAIVTGAALSASGFHDAGNTVASGAAGVGGGLGGAQGGDVLGNNLAQIVCPAPAAPAGKGDAAPAPSDVPAPATTPEVEPSELESYANGFAAGVAAGSGQVAPPSSEANPGARGWASGFVDGFGAAAASPVTAPATTGVPADNSSTGDSATPAEPDSPQGNPEEPETPQGSGDGPVPSTDFPNPEDDGGTNVRSRTLPFGPGIGRYVTDDGDGGFTVVGMPRINPQGGLSDPGILGLSSGQRALGSDEGDGSSSGPSGSLSGPTIGTTKDPENDPRAMGAKQEALRLIGEGVGRILLSGLSLP
jgi:hypothetical protein